MAYRYGIGREKLGGALVKFVLTDFEELRERAYQAAVDDARKRAARLAKLNNVQLGTVLSVQEVQVPGTTTTRTATVYYPGVSTAQPAAKGLRISSEDFAEVPIRVKLLVRFSIEPSMSKTPQQSS